MMCLSRKSIIAALFIATVTILSSRYLARLGRFFPRHRAPVPDPMADFPARLSGLVPTIERLMELGGTPGLALTVTVGGAVVYKKNLGYRNVEARLPVTYETVFPICSLTKALTAAAVGLLVDEGRLTWDTRIRDILPGYAPPDATLYDQLTVADCLSHRSGMAWADNLVVGSAGNILVAGRDGLGFLNTQTRLLPFRAGFAYNNLPYELAGQVVEKLSGQPWDAFVQTRLLVPLGLARTFLRAPPADTADVATCYNALDDASVVPVPCPQAGNDRFAGPSGGGRSCAADLARLYAAFLHSVRDQFSTGASVTKDTPFRQAAHLVSARIAMDTPSRNEASYALGWARVQLPGPMGQIGINPGLLPATGGSGSSGMPVVGQGAPNPPLVLFHQGSLPGALSFVALLPDTDITIVVLSNSLALNDVPDWVGQLVLEELINVPLAQRIDFVAAARTAVATNLAWYPQLERDLAFGRTNGTDGTIPPPRAALEAYTGTYWDEAHIFRIDVTLEDGDTDKDGRKLHWTLQERSTEKFALTHYRDDVFTWLLPRNELSRRGRWVGSDQGPEFWKVQFLSNNTAGTVDALQWAHDVGVPPKVFTKTEKDDKVAEAE